MVIKGETHVGVGVGHCLTCFCYFTSLQQGFEDFNVFKILHRLIFAQSWVCDGTSVLKQPTGGVQEHAGDGDTNKGWKWGAHRY